MVYSIGRMEMYMKVSLIMIYGTGMAKCVSMMGESTKGGGWTTSRFNNVIIGHI